MTDERNSERRTKWTPWACAAAALLAALFAVVAIGGIRGWLVVDPDAAAQREEERKKREEAERRTQVDYEIAAPIVQPGEPDALDQLAKPGHWTTATQQMKANYNDFVGQSLITIVDEGNRAQPIDRTPMVLRAARPVLLSRGRPKVIENTFLVPPAAGETQLVTELVERGFGGTLRRRPTPLVAMPAYQYRLVVLAKEPARYSFVKSLDSVKVPFDGETEDDDIEDAVHYHVALLDANQSIPLADNPLAWTSVAYMLWDGVDPQRLTPQQQQAVIDWLHWGGQLIVSGPDSLDLLRGSFLAPYLPAAGAGATIFAADDPSIAELSLNWTVASAAGEPLAPTAPWSGIRLELHAAAQPLPSTGELFVERTVGRGRVVVSAIQLTERDFVNWRSGFESFFNACLLRRPPREYRAGLFGGATLAWDASADPTLANRRLDARLTTRLRYFARDVGTETAYRYVDSGAQMTNPLGQPGQPVREYRPPENVGGIGAWNDFSATASVARAALREAAGVEVPGASFVVVALAAYLLALVPLNWLVFQAVGRVEWAWVAAPLIAIAGTLLVVHQAQLDIGFVRAQTEIGLLELQPDYDRAHLTRYTALYTSLSSTYELEFDDPTALAAPFATGADFAPFRGQGTTPVDFHRNGKVRLAGLPIASNSTSMVHSEQMFALDGPIRLGRSVALNRPQVENRSQLNLRSVGLVRRARAGERIAAGAELEGMWIGELAPGQSMALALRPLQLADGQVAFVEERAFEEQILRGERLDLEPMFRLAYDAAHLEPGEMRLVARLDQSLPGETITPAASQVRSATLVVAHLEHAPFPKPQPDRNTRRDVKVEFELDE